MAKVICTLPNAGTVINGVKFTADRGQMISEDVTEAAAAGFTAIPGYRTVMAEQKKPSPDKPVEPTKPPTPAKS